MAKKHASVIFQWFISVRGSGEFPWDMLRYDSAFPAEEQETGAMLRSGLRTVVVCRRGVSDVPTTSPERWRSFGWEIVMCERELYILRDRQRAEDRIVASKATKKREASVREAEGMVTQSNATHVKWFHGSTSYDCARRAGTCPMCGAVDSIVALPPPELAKQHDGTTHVCAPFFRGCNHGFALESAK